MKKRNINQDKDKVVTIKKGLLKGEIAKVISNFKTKKCSLYYISLLEYKEAKRLWIDQEDISFIK